MPSVLPSARYYPKLSDIITVNDLPQFLVLIEDSLNSIFNKIHYKNLQYSRSFNGDSASYSLDIVSAKKLQIALPFDLALVLNPDFSGGDSNISSFPVTVEYEWGILAFLKSFSAGGFSFTAEDFYELGLKIFRISDAQALTNIFNLFVFPGTSGTTKFQQVVDDINDFYGFSQGNNNLLQFPPGSSPSIPLLVTLIQQHPGIDKTVTMLLFFIYILDTNLSITEGRLNKFYESIAPEGIQNYIKRIIIPKARATFQLSAAIEFPRNILKPVYDQFGNNPYGLPAGTPYEIIPADVNGDPKVLLRFGEALFYADTEQGLGYNMDISLASSVPAQIANTGLIFNLQNLKIDLSRTSNIPEADLENRPAEFIGVYTENIEIVLPKKWFNQENGQTLKISGKRMLIGTGGISGTIELVTVNDTPPQVDDFFWFRLGKDQSKSWRIGFNRFDITFKQSTVTASSIIAALEIPKLKSSNTPGVPLRFDVLGHLYEDGDFSLTASVAGGIEATLFNFVSFNFLSFELGRKDDNFYIGTACEIWFQNPVMDKLLRGQKIHLPSLRIYSNGQIEIPGGNSFIPVNLNLNLGPIEISVTGIHLGSYQQEHNGVQRKYNYFGFDGAINMDPLGIDARGNGIKYYYTTDNDEHGGDGHSFIRIQSIKIDIIIPGSASPSSALAIISGSLSIPEPGVSPEYEGSVDLKLPQLNQAGGGVAFRLQPKYPAFILDAHLDLPAPIPLGPVGIYGFRGLIGYRYVAEKEAIGLVSGVDTWYDYYKHPVKGVNIDKFSGPERTKDYKFPVSLGAGAVIATSFDSGSVLSIRAMLLLSIPTLFMIEGRASILASRVGLEDDKEPPFFAFIAWGDHSLELGIGADFALSKANGWVVNLHADVQAGFFFNNASRWYVNFGTKQDPVKARVLDLLTTQSFLMLSSAGIEAGARVEFDLRKNFGPAKVHLNAYVEIGGHISFERPQIGGYLALGGMIDIEIWIVGISIGLDAILSVEAGRPFLLYAELKIKVCARIVVKVCKSFSVELKWEKDGTVDRTPIPALPIGTSDTQQDRTGELVKGVNMLTNQSFDLDYFTSVPDQSAVTKIIPLDTYIDFKTVKGLIPNAVDAQIGGHTTAAENFTDLVPPDATVRGGRQLRQVKHTYSIESVEIKAWSGSQWVDYHPYQAIIEGQDVRSLRIGYWQRAGGQYDTLRILATDPFAYTQSGEPGWFIPEQYGINPSSLFCVTDEKAPHCSNVLDKVVGTTYYTPQQYAAHFINGAYYTLLNTVGYDPADDGIANLDGNFMKVTDHANPFGFAKSLAFNNYNSMVILLPDPSRMVNLKFTTTAKNATVSFYHKLISDTSPVPQYTLVDAVVKTAAELTEELVYESAVPISRIVIAPSEPNSDEINGVMEQIAALFNTTYEGGSGNTTVSQPSDIVAYNALLAQLNTLEDEGCTAGSKYFFNYFYSSTSGGATIAGMAFKSIVRMGDYYIMAARLSLTSQPLGLASSLLLKVNGNGEVLAEKTLQGAVDELHVVGDALLVTVFDPTVNGFTMLPVLLKLDASLTQLSGIQLGGITPSSTNRFSPIIGTRYAFWIGANMFGGAGAIGIGTRVLLIDTGAMSVEDTVFISGIAALNCVQAPDGTCIFITSAGGGGGQSQVITVGRGAGNNINVVATAVAAATLTDILLLDNGMVALTGTGTLGDCFVATFSYLNYAFNIFQGYSFGTGALSLVKGSLEGGTVQIAAYSISKVYLISLATAGAVVKRVLTIVPPASNPAFSLHINAIVQNPVNNEIFIVWNNVSVTKGIIVSVIDDYLDCCMLSSGNVNTSMTVAAGTAGAYSLATSAPLTSFTALTTSRLSNSTNVNTRTVLCPPIIRTDDPKSCATSLQQLCWLTVAQSEYNLTIPGQGAIGEDQQAMVEAKQKTAQPIWRPNTKYYIHFRLKDTVDDTASAPGIFDYYYGFKTVGPVGHYHKDPAVTYVPSGANPDQYPLASLGAYIDYERSYPNADGDLLQAKPLFYGNGQCRITVFFSKAEAYHMFQKWYAYNGMPELSGEIHIAVKDPATDVLIPYPLPSGWTEETVPLPEAGTVWSSDDDPRIPLNLRILNNMVDYVNSHSTVIRCTLTIGQAIVPAAYKYALTLTNLSPEKLYTALLYNAFELNNDNVLKSEEVHQFVFRTSRYASFTEQVNSYLLDDGNGNTKNAVFALPVTATSTNIITAYNIITGMADAAGDALASKYIHLFDRVTEGVFGLVQLQPAVTTEFNLLKESVSGDTLALLIRNPEPFNNPRMPLSSVDGTIMVLKPDGQPDPDYQVLFSKDYAEALIMHSSKKITAISLAMKFVYKTWDGSAYTLIDTIITPLIPINI